MSSAISSSIPNYMPGTWSIDPLLSTVRFSVKHFGIQRVYGEMTVRGDVVVAEEPAASSVTAAIDLHSVDTGNRGRDDAIRSPKVLDTGHRPTATYRSEPGSIYSFDDDPRAFLLQGKLTVMGIKGQVPLHITVSFMAARDRPHVVVHGKGSFDRHDFGLRPRVGPSFLDRTISSIVEVEVRVTAGLRERTTG